MKLQLIVLASLLNLAMGWLMVELTGLLPPCTGDELALLQQCLPVEEEEAVGKGGERALLTGFCSGCQGLNTFKGHFCYTMCRPSDPDLDDGARRLEEGTSLRHLQGTEFSAAVYNLGNLQGAGIALDYAQEIINCVGNVTANHPCLGDAADMNLVVFA
jgi:hypothetical protein